MIKMIKMIWNTSIIRAQHKTSIWNLEKKNLVRQTFFRQPQTSSYLVFWIFPWSEFFFPVIWVAYLFCTICIRFSLGPSDRRLILSLKAISWNTTPFSSPSPFDIQNSINPHVHDLSYDEIKKNWYGNLKKASTCVKKPVESNGDVFRALRWSI